VATICAELTSAMHFSIPGSLEERDAKGNAFKVSDTRDANETQLSIGEPRQMVTSP
jgi:hypothetical protein